MKNQTSTFLPFALLTEDDLRAAHAEVVEEINLSQLSHPSKTKILVVTYGDAPHLSPDISLLTNFNFSDSSCEKIAVVFGWGATLVNLPTLIHRIVCHQETLEKYKSGNPIRISGLTANGRPYDRLRILPNRLKVGYSMSYDSDHASFTTFDVVGILLISD